jgi:CheY-like chemotaxis protein
MVDVLEDCMARILLVDDEAETLRMLGQVVRLLGHTPVAADGWAGAEPSLNAGMPDLILLDLMMPDVDGFEAIKRIRARPDGRHVPIVVITASPELDVEERVADQGGNAAFRKPISINVLSQMIEQHLALVAAVR